MPHHNGRDDVGFWSLIDRLGPDLNPARLTMALSTLAWDQVFSFRTTMTVMASALDSRSHQQHGLAAYEHAQDRPDADEAVAAPLVLAEFAELTMTVVALGHDAWSAIVAVPGLLAGSWPTGLGRQLVRVTDAALASALRAELAPVPVLVRR